MSEISFLITARNEDPEKLERSLRSALEQSSSGDVVLVDDGSTTPIETDLPVTVLRIQQSVGISAARNAGMRLLPASRFLAVFNCDVLLPTDWAKTCGAYLDAAPVNLNETRAHGV